MSTTLPRTETTAPRFAGLVLFSMFACGCVLDLCLRRVGGSSRRQDIGQVKASHPNAVVGHPVIDVEALRFAKIVAPVDPGGKYHVVNHTAAFLRQRRRQHRLSRTIADDERMLLREHHYPGRVAKLVSGAGVHDFAHAVVDDQPAVPGEYGRSAAADFEPLPGRHWSCQPVMRSKLAEARWFAVLQGHPAVGNPDALPFEIHVANRGPAGGFLRARAREKRPGEHGPLRGTRASRC